MATKRRGRAAGGLAILLLVVTGCQNEAPTVTKPEPIRPDPDIAQAPSNRLKPYYSQNLNWEDCGDRPEKEAGRPKDMQCAQVLVPRDYDRPRAERIKLSISRLPAVGPESERIGSLLVRPGGRGQSGIGFLASSAQRFDGAVRERFDLVTFDQRGVGRSSPVQCLKDPAKNDSVAERGAAAASGDLEAALRLQENLAEACEQRSGEMLAHVGTEDAARDLDVLRAVLGDRNLSYLGYSYGAKLGATYASLFPDKFRALVLDHPVAPDADPLEQAVARAEGGGAALRDFARDCLEQEDCPLAAEDAEAAVDEINALIDQAAEEPLANSDDPDRKVGAGWVAAGLRAGLRSEQSWPRLRSALADALEAGDGAKLMRLGEKYLGRSQDGSWTNSLEAGMAIRCADWPPVERERAEQAAAELTGEAKNGEAKTGEAEGDGARPGSDGSDTAPSDEAGGDPTTSDQDAATQGPGLFVRDVQWSWLKCRDWPVTQGEKEQLTVEATAPALILGRKQDPATPHSWAKQLAKLFLEERLVTYRGKDHGAYGSADSPCVDDAVDAYLIHGDLPEPDTTCPRP